MPTGQKKLDGLIGAETQFQAAVLSKDRNNSSKLQEEHTMKIRGEEVRLPCSMIGGYPRPHWLQGRVFGSLHEPLYRSMDLRIAYEDAGRLAAPDQALARLHHVRRRAPKHAPWAPGAPV